MKKRVCGAGNASCNLMALSPAPRMLIASMLWETAQSRREHRIRRGGEEEKAEDLLSREQLEEARTSCCRGCAPAPLCVCAKQQAVSAQHGRRGKEGEQEGEGDCALRSACMFAVTQTTRQGLTAMPIGAAWWWCSHIQEGGGGEGVKRERWQAGQH